MLLHSHFVNSDLSLVFIDRVNNKVYIHRDPYGKRSLCLQVSESTGEMLISSRMMVDNTEANDFISFEL